MRLAEIDWQNMMIERDVSRCRIRFGRDVRTDVFVAPAQLYDDLRELYSQTYEAYSRNTNEPDFPLNYDGMRIRGALVARDIFALRRALRKVPSLKQCGVHPKIIQHVVNMKAGTIFIFGGFSTGKTTTASALQIEYVRDKPRIGFTLEDPIELEFDGDYGIGRIVQISVRRSEIEKRMEEIMRTNFDSLMISEIRSGLMAQTVYQAGAAGRLITVTGHGTSIEEGFSRVNSLASATNTGGDTGAQSNLSLLADSFQLAILMNQVDDGVYGATEYLIGDNSTRSLLRKGDFSSLKNAIQQTMAHLNNPAINSRTP